MFYLEKRKREEYQLNAREEINPIVGLEIEKPDIETEKVVMMTQSAGVQQGNNE